MQGKDFLPSLGKTFGRQFAVQRINNIMKKLIYLTFVAFALMMTSCVSTRTSGRSGKVPPGQAKKMYGTKSAKPFAPGQNKYR